MTLHFCTCDGCFPVEPGWVICPVLHLFLIRILAHSWHMPFLIPNQQCQSIQGSSMHCLQPRNITRCTSFFSIPLHLLSDFCTVIVLKLLHSSWKLWLVAVAILSCEHHKMSLWRLSRSLIFSVDADLWYILSRQRFVCNYLQLMILQARID